MHCEIYKYTVYNAKNKSTIYIYKIYLIKLLNTSNLQKLQCDKPGKMYNEIYKYKVYKKKIYFKERLYFVVSLL